MQCRWLSDCTFRVISATPEQRQRNILKTSILCKTLETGMYFHFTNLKKNLMYAILICVFSKKVNVCNFRDMWKKNNFLLNQALFFYLYRNVYMYINREFGCFMYLEAWFYSWLHFDLYIFLWLWYLMYTWLYNELLFLNVFFFFFSEALFASRLQALCGGTMSRIFSGREFRNQSRFSKQMVAMSLKITLDFWKAVSNNI